MTPSPSDPILLTLEEAGRRVGYSADHLRGEFYAGRLALKNTGTPRQRRYRVELRELQRWANDLPDAIPGQQSA